MIQVNRLGFTEISSAEEKQQRCNIILVHGLRGHPRRTWTSKVGKVPDPNAELSRGFKRLIIPSLRRSRSSSDTSVKVDPQDLNSSEVFWPQDFLPEDVPEARVWTYGYNSDPLGSFSRASNQNSISQHGTDFANKIDREIDNEDPILFVAHSLGGILVKDAFRKSRRCRSQTRMIVFLGTPHRGSSLADWGQLAKNIANIALIDTNERIIKNLEVDSEVLNNIHENFLDIIKDCGDLRIHSFFEARGLAARGITGKVVSDFSSKLDLRGIETVESIDANHMEMARCTGRTDERYQVIMKVLRNSVRVQWSEAEAKKLAQLKTLSLRLLNTLKFPGMDRRYNSIQTDPTHASGSWLFENCTYQNWERSSSIHSLHLVMKGKPGSGKSFLMKRAVHESEANEKTSKIITLHFFFGPEDMVEQGMVKNSVQELRQSLLCQLIQKSESFPSNFFDTYDFPPEYIWDEFDVSQAMIELSAHSNTHGFGIRIYIDDIYQCTETLETMEYLKSVEMGMSGAHNFKYCFSIRHDQDLPRFLDDASIINIEEHSSADMIRFLYNSLENINMRHLQEKSLDLIAGMMAKYASGNFLWARLVLDDLRRRRPVDDDQFVDRLKNTPKDMGAIYIETLSELDDSAKNDCVNLFQLLIFARTPVTSIWLKHALAYLGQGDEQTFEHALFKLGSEEDFQGRIRILSQGLVQFRKLSDIASDEGPAPAEQKATTYVGFIHSTVRHYLQKEGLAVMTGVSENEAEPRGHRLLFELCAKVINMETMDENMESPFAQYVGYHWIHHARLSGKLVNDMKLPAAVINCGYKSGRLVAFYQSQYSKNPETAELNTDYLKEETNLMVVLAAEGCSEIIEEHISHCRKCGKEMKAPESSTTAPTVWDRALFHAAFSKQAGVVKILRTKARHKCHANRMVYNDTAMYRACLEGEVEIVECLLQMGFDCQMKVKNVYATGLHAATYRNWERTLRTLFSFQGHDTRQLLELRDYEGYTPLHIACSNNYIQSARVFLEYIEVKELPADEIFALKDKDGKTPLDLASENGHKSLVTLCRDLSEQQAYDRE